MADPAETVQAVEEPEMVPEATDEIVLSQEPKTEFIAALDEFKQLVQTELQALRQEIQQLKKALAEKK